MHSMTMQYRPVRGFTSVKAVLLVSAMVLAQALPSHSCSADSSKYTVTEMSSDAAY